MVIHCILVILLTLLDDVFKALSDTLPVTVYSPGDTRTPPKAQLLET